MPLYADILKNGAFKNGTHHTREAEEQVGGRELTGRRLRAHWLPLWNREKPLRKGKFGVLRNQSDWIWNLPHDKQMVHLRAAVPPLMPVLAQRKGGPIWIWGGGEIYGSRSGCSVIKSCLPELLLWRETSMHRRDKNRFLSYLLSNTFQEESNHHRVMCPHFLIFTTAGLLTANVFITALLSAPVPNWCSNKITDLQQRENSEFQGTIIASGILLTCMAVYELLSDTKSTGDLNGKINGAGTIRWLACSLICIEQYSWVVQNLFFRNSL